MRATKILALTIAAAFAHDALGQALEKPRRRPDGGGYFAVTAEVPFTRLEGALAGDTFEGKLWFERQMGKRLRGSSTLAPSGAPLGDFALELDADLDPAGAEEDIRLANVPELFVRRAAASSDFAFFPVRMLVPHLTHFEARSRRATKEVKVPGSTQEMIELDLATPPLHGEPTETYFTRTIRRFQPSGFELHDYVLTLKKKPEDYVLASRGLRLLVHPSATTAGGERPTGGVFHVSRLAMRQLDFRDDAELLEPQDLSKFDERFRERLLDQLFEGMQTEGLGDPFDSPAAVGARASGLLDDRAIARLCNMAHPKSMASLAPLLVEGNWKYDPAAYAKAWAAADDPAERLLLAAGAAKGGHDEPRFAQELDLAAESKDANVRRAALVLAKAMKDTARAAAFERG